MSTDSLRHARSRSSKLLNQPMKILDPAYHQPYRSIYKKNTEGLTNFEEFIKSKIDNDTILGPKIRDDLPDKIVNKSKNASKTSCLTERTPYKLKDSLEGYIPKSSNDSAQYLQLSNIFKPHQKRTNLLPKVKKQSGVARLPAAKLLCSNDLESKERCATKFSHYCSPVIQEGNSNRKTSLPTDVNFFTDNMSPVSLPKESESKCCYDQQNYIFSLQQKWQDNKRESLQYSQTIVEQLMIDNTNCEKNIQKEYIRRVLAQEQKEETLQLKEAMEKSTPINIMNVSNDSDKIQDIDDSGSCSNLEQDIKEPNNLFEAEQKRFYNQLKLNLKKFPSPDKQLKAASMYPTLLGWSTERKILNTEESRQVSPESQRNQKQNKLSHWLESRKDFEESKKKHLQEKNMQIIKICNKVRTTQRTRKETNIVAEWLKNVKFFSSIPSSLHPVIAEKLRYRFYEKGENLCITGELGDCLYIIYDGLVKCYVNGTEVARYRKYDAPGQSALHGSRARSATLVAVVPTHVLRLERLWKYDCCLYEFNKKKHFVVQQQEEIYLFLQGIDIFKWMDAFQIKKLAGFMQTKQYVKGERVYSEGDSAESFYILRSGLLKVETILTIEKRNLWPVANYFKDAHLWMKTKLERKTRFTDYVQPKEYFGEIELLKKCKRLNSVICVENSQLLILNKVDFFNCLGPDLLHEFLNVTRENFGDNPDVMRSKILKQEEKKKKMIDIMSRNWSQQLRSLSESEAKKKNERVIEPIIKKLEKDLKAFVRETTSKTLKTEVVTNYPATLIKF